MDVVDTLRHKELMLAREVEADDREQRLLERLREIYTGQGIAVSDDVLKQGVAALQEERFHYNGPVPSFSRSLATLYVTRARWGKWVTTGVAVVAIGAAAFQFGIRGPELRAEATLPGELQSAYQTVVAETQDPAALTEGASSCSTDGKAQIDQHDFSEAGATVGALHGLDFKLRAAVPAQDRATAWRAQRRVPCAGRQSARAQLLRDRRGARAGRQSADDADQERRGRHARSA